jgi:hypothetical protein
MVMMLLTTMTITKDGKIIIPPSSSPHASSPLGPSSATRARRRTRRPSSSPGSTRTRSWASTSPSSSRPNHPSTAAPSPPSPPRGSPSEPLRHTNRLSIVPIWPTIDSWSLSSSPGSTRTRSWGSTPLSSSRPSRPSTAAPSPPSPPRGSPSEPIGRCLAVERYGPPDCQGMV